MTYVSTECSFEALEMMGDPEEPRRFLGRNVRK